MSARTVRYLLLASLAMLTYLAIMSMRQSDAEAVAAAPLLRADQSPIMVRAEPHVTFKPGAAP